MVPRNLQGQVILQTHDFCQLHEVDAHEQVNRHGCK